MNLCCLWPRGMELNRKPANENIHSCARKDKGKKSRITNPHVSEPAINWQEAMKKLSTQGTYFDGFLQLLQGHLVVNPAEVKVAELRIAQGAGRYHRFKDGDANSTLFGSYVGH